MTTLHEQVDELINEAYARKSGGNPLTPQERVQKAGDLIEAYYKQTELKPPSAVLSRLAWYIVFDEMTDRHPDKVTREEYPIMSDWQADIRQDNERSISDVYTGKGDESIGRHNDGSGVKRRIYDYMTPERDMSLVPSEYLDLYDALDNAGLTARQRQAIDLVYFDGMTQEDAADVMGVSQQAVDQFIHAGISKIRRYTKK